MLQDEKPRDGSDTRTDKPVVAPVRLRRCGEGDQFLVQRWLKQAVAVDVFGSVGAGQAQVRLAQQSPTALSRIVELGTDPIGYAHAFDPGGFGTNDLINSADLPAGSLQTVLLIDNIPGRGRTVASLAVSALCKEVFGTTLAPSVFAMVPIRCEPLVRGFEAAGLVWSQVVQDPRRGPLWLLVRSR